MTSVSSETLTRAAYQAVRARQQELVDTTRSVVLSNGARCHLVSEGEHGITAFEVWVGVGAGDEPADRAGISHLLEHLMFRGTRAVPDGEFDIRVQALGADANAWTWYDSTAYTTMLASENLPELLALEADRFEHLEITERVFQTERDVVLNERSLTADSDPNALAQEHLDRMLFGEGPYGVPVIGYKAQIEALTRGDATAWYRTHYAPKALDIFVAGDLQIHPTLRALEETFGRISDARREPPPRVTSATHRVDQTDTVTLPIAEPLILMAWPLPGSSDRRGLAAWRLFQECLTFGQGGYLRRALEHTDRWVLDQHMYVQEHRLGHSAQWEATPRDGVSSRALVERFYALMDTLARDGIATDALHAARMRIVHDLAAQTAPWQIIHQLGGALHRTGRIDTIARDLDALQAVGVDDIRSLARRCASEANNALLYVTPE